MVITNGARVVEVGRGGLTMTKPVVPAGGGSVVATTVGVVGTGGGLPTPPTAVGLVRGEPPESTTVGADVGRGPLTKVVPVVGGGASAPAGDVGVEVGDGGLVMRRPPSDPHPDPKAATRTTGMAKVARRRNVLRRGSLGRMSASPGAITAWTTGTGTLFRRCPVRSPMPRS